MWIFTTLGFYSVVCAERVDGSIDERTVMVRARLRAHLVNLQERFEELRRFPIRRIPFRDYKYRLIVPKDTWAACLQELAESVDYQNFKEASSEDSGASGIAYVYSLEGVWEQMLKIQE